MKFYLSSSTNKPYQSTSALDRQDIQKIAHGIAHLLDSSLTIPGTGLKIGLDPIIGLILGIGDLIANAVGSMLLFLATKAGVPKIVIFRMSLNICLNLVLGAIPVIGDVFSVWFKSNTRNAKLLDRYCQSKRYRAELTDWLYVGTIIGGIILTMIGILYSVWWLFSFLYTLTTQ